MQSVGGAALIVALCEPLAVGGAVGRWCSLDCGLMCASGGGGG